MGKYRILKNQDHCLIQVRKWFLWFYLYKPWHAYRYKLTLFRFKADKYTSVASAENSIMFIKEEERKLKKVKSKYRVVMPKNDSSLYNVLNRDEDED